MRVTGTFANPEIVATSTSPLPHINEQLFPHHGGYYLANYVEEELLALMKTKYSLAM